MLDEEDQDESSDDDEDSVWSDSVDDRSQHTTGSGRDSVADRRGSVSSLDDVEAALKGGGEGEVRVVAA